jgi:uncharacterized protein (TIGR02996 family)
MERSRCPCCGGKLQPLDEMPNWVMMGLGCGSCAVSYNVGSQGIGPRKPELVIFGRNNYCSFLQSILADPLNDTTRLVFADWLEEHDEPNRACYQRLEVAKRDVLREPQSDEARLRYAGICESHGEVERAQFIRAQLELAKTPAWDDFECKVCSAKPNEEGEIRHGRGCYMLSEDGGGEEWADENPKHEVLRMQCAKLVDNPNGQWFKWIYPLDDSGRVRMVERMETRRGFVHSISLSAAQAEMYLDEVLEEQPIECVTLTSRPEATRIRISQVMPYYDEMEFCGRVIRVSEELMVESRFPQGGVDANRLMPHVLHARWPSVPVEGWKLSPVNAFDAGSTAFRRLREQLVAIPPQVIREIMGLDQPLSPDEPLTPR